MEIKFIKTYFVTIQVVSFMFQLPPTLIGGVNNSSSALAKINSFFWLMPMKSIPIIPKAGVY